jgi:transcriptional regulator with XRE-family HTH domain
VLKTLGDLLAALREDAHLSQQQLGDRIGYSRASVAGAEAAIRMPAEAFWRRSDDVLGGGGVLRRAYEQLAEARAAKIQEARRLADIERQTRIDSRLAELGLPLPRAECSAPSSVGLVDVGGPVDSADHDNIGSAVGGVELGRQLGESLTIFRESAGFSQAELGRQITYDRTTVSHAERGSHIPGREFWQACDSLLSADGTLRARYERWQQARREETAKADAARRGAAQQRRLSIQEESVPAPTVDDAPEIMSGLRRIEDLLELDAISRRVFLATFAAVSAAAATDAIAPPLTANPLANRALVRAAGAVSAACWAAPIVEAVVNPTDVARRTMSQTGSDDPADMRTLGRATEQATQASLSSNYVELARSLPRLIGRTEAASLQVTGHAQIELLRVLSDVYAVAGWSLIKADLAAVASSAAERAIQLAEQADDALRLAAATRCLAEVHMRAGDYANATRTALFAAAYLDAAQSGTDPAVVLCLRGAALLSASAAAARHGYSRDAHTALTAASRCADLLDADRSDLGTVFGPTNVSVHRVAVALELGDAREAARRVPDVDLGRLPRELTERRGRFLIDVSRAHAHLKNDSAALDALLQAERIAPDELRSHRLTRDVLADLLARERRGSGLRELAARCGAIE